MTNEIVRPRNPVLQGYVVHGPYLLLIWASVLQRPSLFFLKGQQRENGRL